jgi:hypothetical protein
LENTTKLISVLESDAGIPASLLVDIKKGKSLNFIQGTWIHPDLAIQLAQWLNPEFAIHISHWIKTLFTTGKVEINLKALKKQEIVIKEYESRIKYLEDLTLKRHCRTKYPESNVVYIVTNEDLKKKRTYVIGKALDLTERLSAYNKAEDFEVIYYRGFSSEKKMNLAETMVLEKLDEYRKQANRDRVILPVGEDINVFTEVIDKAFIYLD